MFIDPYLDSLKPSVDKGIPNTNNLDHTEILRAFETGNSRPLRDLLRDLQERAHVLIESPILEKSMELVDAFSTLTPTVLGLGLACGWPIHNKWIKSYSLGSTIGIEISRDHLQHELGNALPGMIGNGKSASIGDTIVTLRDLYVKMLTTATTSEACAPLGDRSPIFQTLTEAAQTSASPSIEREERACMIPNENLDQDVGVIRKENGVEQSVANSINQVCTFADTQTKQIECVQHRYCCDIDTDMHFSGKQGLYSNLMRTSSSSWITMALRRP